MRHMSKRRPSKRRPGFYRRISRYRWDGPMSADAAWLDERGTPYYVSNGGEAYSLLRVPHKDWAWIASMDGRIQTIKAMRN